MDDSSADRDGSRASSANPASDKSAGELFPLVYDQLRILARRRMSDEKPGHTLQATALVHEVYLRLAGSGQAHWSDKSQFFFAAAEAMRRILIDHARSRGRLGLTGPLFDESF